MRLRLPKALSLKRLGAATLAPLALPAMAALAGAVTFDNLPAGPAAWAAAEVGADEGQWKTRRDNSTLRIRDVPGLPANITRPSRVKDGFVEATFRPVSGREDSAGGLVWRAKDSDNYYLARVDVSGGSVTISYTVNGRRTEKKRASVQALSNLPYTLRVEFKGAHVAVICDGQKTLEWDDDTFKDAGKVGIWSKADSVTFFDEFSFGAR